LEATSPQTKKINKPLMLKMATIAKRVTPEEDDHPLNVTSMTKSPPRKSYSTTEVA
jgi:hypothetical protein